ncbi:branched-chain amino acid ABC transporter permease [Roseibium sp.]|uniref:branched-chain amino acid ABC transporter permease n=1 Tax=Roseibium sp. TaxID=1936156 RepID=UPI003A97F491
MIDTTKLKLGARGRRSPALTIGIWVLTAATLVLLPQIFSSGLAISTMCLMGTMIIFALSYNMLLGQTGLLSFGHAVFFGLGGFLTVHMLNAFAGGGLPFGLVVYPVFGAITGLIFGIVFGAVATKRAGTAFAMITLGIGELVASSALILRYFFGGEEGITVDRTDLVHIFGWSFGPQIQIYYLIAVWCLISMGCMYALTRTPFGRICNAVRDNPHRVQFIGYNTGTVRFIAFSLAGLFAGIAGALAAINFEIVNSAQMSSHESGAVILMTYIGGVGNFAGPILGAILITYLQLSLSDITEVWELYFGLMFIAMVMFAPRGLAGILAAQVPLIRNGSLLKVLPYYLAALVPGLIALTGFSMVIEMTHQLSVATSEGTSMSFLYVPFEANSILAWALALCLFGGGTWVFLRTAKMAGEAYGAAVTIGRGQ